MDNLTHSLVGLLIGETAATLATDCPAESRQGLPAAQKRNALLGLMLVGSNFPDFDLFYTTFAGGKLDYLLQHRGYTHTVIGALIATAIMLGTVEWWLRRRQLRPTSRDRLQLAAAALLAPLLHIAMDFTNNYGVHPFWPFYNGWLYGDSVFIVEPLLWAIAAPLAFLLRSKWARCAIWLVLIGGAGLCFFSGMVPIAATCVFLALAATLLALTKYSSSRIALLAGVGCWIATTIVFVTTSRIAAARIDAVAAAAFPGYRTLDHVLTPLPVNPVCWDVLLIQRDATNEVIRRAALSLAPEWMSAQHCPGGLMATPATAQLSKVQQPDTMELRWNGEVTSSLAKLQELASSRCEASALMRFARAPVLTPTATTPSTWTLGDLRYDREPGNGFAEVRLLPEEQPACPKHVPPWIAPREDLLRTMPAP